MTRVTTTILIFLMLMNGTVGMMAASGLTSQLGVALAPGVSDTMDDVQDRAERGFSPASGFGETLFALFMSGITLIQGLIKGVFAAPQLFINLGFPPWTVIPLMAPVYVIATLEILFMATGRDMV